MSDDATRRRDEAIRKIIMRVAVRALEKGKKMPKSEMLAEEIYNSTGWTVTTSVVDVQRSRLAREKRLRVSTSRKILEIIP